MDFQISRRPDGNFPCLFVVPEEGPDSLVWGYITPEGVSALLSSHTHTIISRVCSPVQQGARRRVLWLCMVADQQKDEGDKHAACAHISTSILTHTQNEARPELWGRYAMVLNKQQGLLRDSCLEVASSSAPGAYYPPHISGVHTNILATSEGGVTEGEAYAQAPHTLPSHEYQPLHQHQHQQHSHQQQQYQQHQQQPSSSALTPLPSTATRLESRLVLCFCVFDVHARVHRLLELTV